MSFERLKNEIIGISFEVIATIVYAPSIARLFRLQVRIPNQIDVVHF